MISLEQVQLLESRVSRAIEYVQKANAENAALVSEKAVLQAKLDAYQKRIEELEVFVLRFKDEQGRIEDGIIAALDRLSQFEEAFEGSLKEQNVRAAAKKPAKKAASDSAGSKSADLKSADSKPLEVKSEAKSEEVFFEIAEGEAGKDDDMSADGELDIF